MGPRYRRISRLIKIRITLYLSCLHPDVYTYSDTTIGGSARKQSYEPLLLENEREAVSELLHHLESKSGKRNFDKISGLYQVTFHLYQTERPPISSLDLPSLPLPPSHSATMLTSNDLPLWLSRKSRKRK